MSFDYFVIVYPWFFFQPFIFLSICVMITFPLLPITWIIVTSTRYHGGPTRTFQSRTRNYNLSITSLTLYHLSYRIPHLRELLTFFLRFCYRGISLLFHINRVRCEVFQVIFKRDGSLLPLSVEMVLIGNRRVSGICLFINSEAR